MMTFYQLIRHAFSNNPVLQIRIATGFAKDSGKSLQDKREHLPMGLASLWRGSFAASAGREHSMPARCLLHVNCGKRVCNCSDCRPLSRKPRLAGLYPSLNNRELSCH
jgi:hypothetical protein